MTDISVYDAVPVDVPVVAPARPRLLVIATTLVCVAATMGMSGLVGVYISTRADALASGATWLPPGVVIPLTQPNMMAVTLLLSVLTMVWAVSSIRHDDRSNSYIALALALVFGFAYLAQSAYLLNLMAMPIAGDDLGRPPLLFAIIGFHMALVGCAMLYAVAMGFRALGGNYSAKDLEGYYGVAIFWSVTVALYLVVWYTIYITK